MSPNDPEPSFLLRGGRRGGRHNGGEKVEEGRGGRRRSGVSVTSLGSLALASASHSPRLACTYPSPAPALYLTL
eukprot:588943-Rhodomonas_salina.1